jgi:hypothetical protein
MSTAANPPYISCGTTVGQVDRGPSHPIPPHLPIRSFFPRAFESPALENLSGLPAAKPSVSTSSRARTRATARPDAFRSAVELEEMDRGRAIPVPENYHDLPSETRNRRGEWVTR